MSEASEVTVGKRRLADLSDESLRGRRVFVRVDFNVPVGEEGNVGADTRIRRSLPTLRRLIDAGSRIVLLSHLGRPGGSPSSKLSLERVGRRVAELLGTPVRTVSAVSGPDVAEAVAALEPAEVVLLENTRFHPGEEANDPALCREWADLADVYVSDAFGSAHRAHASTVGLPEAIREKGGLAVAGYLMDEELRFLHEALVEPDSPFVSILGGAKISGKIDVVEALLPRVDRLLVGGAMANTFLRAMGLETGTSLVEDDRLETAREILGRAGEKLILPVDCIAADRIEEGVATRVAERTGLSSGDAIGDIGPETRSLFSDFIADAGTIVWNGPMGVFELDGFDQGTLAVAGAVADASDRGSLTVVGGGDSAAAVEAAGVADRIDHISTGGGAALDLLAGAELPGIEALSEPGC